MQSYTTAGKEAYITLSDGDHMNKVHTCGDAIRGQAHYAAGSEGTSLTYLGVNFKCKARTLVTTHGHNHAAAGPANRRQVHKTKAYLFFYSTVYISEPTRMRSRQSFDFEFAFPWFVQPHPTQAALTHHPSFAGGPGTPLPPSFAEYAAGNPQSVAYYLEIVAIRPGKLMTHKIKDRLPILFCPPRAAPDPRADAALVSGSAAQIRRESRLLDPKRRDEPYGLKEKTKHFFSASANKDPDPVAVFAVSARVANAGCILAPVDAALDVSYDAQRSTAPEQPPLCIAGLHARFTCVTDVRVVRHAFSPLFSGYDAQLLRTDYRKVDFCRVGFEPPRPVRTGAGFALAELTGKLALPPDLPPTFRSPTLSRGYVLKISAEFVCAGKKFDVELGRLGFCVLPDVYRPFPGQQYPGPPPPPMQMPPPTPTTNAGGEAVRPTFEQAPPSYHEAVGDDGSKTSSAKAAEEKR